MTDSQFFGIVAHVWLAAFAVSFGRISPDTAEPLRPDWRGGVRAAVRAARARSRVKDHERGCSTNPAKSLLDLVEMALPVRTPVQVWAVGTCQGRSHDLVGYGQQERIDL